MPDRISERIVETRPPDKIDKGHRNLAVISVAGACGTLLIAAILISPFAFRQASSEPAPVVSQVTCPRAPSPCRAAPLDLKDLAISAARTTVPLFFGYVEFDADPDRPGGIHGFGPWPPPDSAPQDHAAAR